LSSNDGHEINSLYNAIGVIAEEEFGYVWLTHEFMAGLDTFEENLD
jgi:hypothetical protein